jgi:hypothetical protein
MMAQRWIFPLTPTLSHRERELYSVVIKPSMLFPFQSFPREGLK